MKETVLEKFEELFEDVYDSENDMHYRTLNKQLDNETVENIYFLVKQVLLEDVKVDFKLNTNDLNAVIPISKVYFETAYVKRNGKVRKGYMYGSIEDEPVSSMCIDIETGELVVLFVDGSQRVYTNVIAYEPLNKFEHIKVGSE